MVEMMGIAKEALKHGFLWQKWSCNYQKHLEVE